MILSINHPRFQNKKLSVSTQSIFKRSCLLLDGIEQKSLSRFKKRYLVEDDDGLQIAIEVKTFVDPIPTVIIAGEKIRLAPPMTWYQYIFLLMPCLLVIFGGMIGGMIGGIGAVINGSIIRSQGNVIFRYGACIVVALLCYISYIIVGYILLRLFS